MGEQEILQELKTLNKKVDRLLSLVELRQSQEQEKRSKKSAKPKPAPLSEDEMQQHQRRFTQLYERWLSGDELAVQEQLDKLEPEELRRFADSNNLNVTSKMSKERVLHLIGARFREKKQLHHTRSVPSSPTQDG